MTTLINRINVLDRPVTLDDAKKQIKVTHDFEDDVIKGYIESAIEYCEDCTNTLIQLSLVKNYFECDVIKLSRPVRAIKSIKYIDESGDIQQIIDYSYKRKYDNGLIVKLSNIPGSKGTWVEYVAGYGNYTPSADDIVINETVRTLPAVIKHCILLLLSFDFVTRSTHTDFKKFDTNKVDQMLYRYKVYE